MTRRPLAICVFAAAVCMVTVAAPTAARVPWSVSLSIGGSGSSSLQTGGTVQLIARAPLGAGQRIVVTAWPSNGRSRRLASCPYSPCVVRWRGTTAQTVEFRATLLQVNKTLAKSRIVRVRWTGTAVPPPPPVAAGHYQGTTSQNEVFAFDVTADGSRIVNLTTGQINSQCTPRLNLHGGNLRNWTAALAGGAFSIDTTGSGNVDNNPATFRTQITGRIANGIAQGTLQVSTSFNSSGVSYSCSSGNQTWQATRTP